ncbi:MAG: SGNH/GDSL hydrolase family protein [Myxococcota bacterium]
MIEGFGDVELPRRELVVDDLGFPASVLYVALGDSTGVGVGAHDGGYVDRLFNRMRHARPVSQLINLCQCAAGTEQVLQEQLPRALEHRPSLWTLGVGINDITRMADLDEMVGHFGEILRGLRGHAEAPVVTWNIPCVLHAPGIPPHLRALLDAHVAECNEELQRAAARHPGVMLVDVYEPTRRELALHPEYFSDDGFHPSDAGYEYCVELLWPVVRDALMARTTREAAG